MKRNLLLLIFALFAFSAYAQEGGVKGTVVSRGSRAAIGKVKVSIPALGVETVSTDDGHFVFNGIEKGEYDVDSQGHQLRNACAGCRKTGRRCR